MSEVVVKQTKMQVKHTRSQVSEQMSRKRLAWFAFRAMAWYLVRRSGNFILHWGVGQIPRVTRMEFVLKS